MPYTPVTWVASDPITDTKLQNMATNDDYLKAIVDKAPVGVLAAATRTTNNFTFSGAGATAPNSVTITGLSVASVTIPANRTIRVTGGVRSFSSDVVNSVFEFQLFRDTTQIAGRNIRIDPTGTGVEGGEISAIILPAAGTYSFSCKVMIIIPTDGSGGGAAQFSSSVPGYIMVEDCGAAISIPNT